MQAFPNRPIRIITTAPGSDVDMLTRLIAQGIAGPLGQPVTVDNRTESEFMPGEIVSKAPPDGYTLLLSTQTFWIASLLQNLPYDPMKDFSPITLAGTSPLIVVVHPLVPADSIKGLIALAKQREGTLSYGSGPNGHSSQLAGALFTHMAGANIVRIAYKRGPAAMSDLIAGKLQLMIPSAGVAMEHVKLGELRALAVTSAQPSAAAPSLPTVAASGLPGFEIVQRLGMFAPANTPATIIKRLNHEIVRFLNTTQVKKQLLDAAVEPVGSTPEEFAAQVKSELAKWGKVIREVGIRAD